MQARLLQRRAVLLGSSTGLIASSREAYDAVAQQSQNPNVSDSFKKLEDRIEGFSLQYPSDWLKVNVRDNEEETHSHFSQQKGTMMKHSGIKIIRR